MKKILFSAYSLDIGGIETALITLLKELATKYEITLVLEKKQGIFLEEVPENIKIITYEASNNKIVLLRKASNVIKQTLFKIKHKNKYDFAGCFATYSKPASFIARTASKNNALWVHNNYMNFYNNDITQYRNFFIDLKIYDYKKVIFVSDYDKKVFTAHFPECSKRTIVCNNLIDYEKILKLSNEKITDLEEDKEVTFINVGRHDEKQKKLTRIIEATKKLNKEGYKFRVLFVGKGSATKEYQEISKNINNIEFLGAKQNPYPYIKQSDCVVMSSDFEGYPVVFVEAEILDKPIITTDVSDSKKDIKDKYGIVVDKSTDGIYKGMKKFITEGFKPKKFNPKEYNNNILEKLDLIIQK